MPADFHVAIIGAGIGGLSLAQSLKRLGVPFTVFEKDPALDSRTQGYRIRIDEAGRGALADCLPPALYRLFRRSCAQTGPAGRFFDTQLRETVGRAAEHWRPATQTEDSEHDGGDLRVHRQTLREILLCGIEAHVQFGKGFARFRQQGDKLAIDFDDGASRLCDVLVAADGVHSQVRRQLAPNAAPAETGAVCLYGKTLLTPANRQRLEPRLCAGPAVVFADECVVVIDAMTFAAPLPGLATQAGLAGRFSAVDDYLYWALYCPQSMFAQATPNGEAAAGAEWAARLASVARDWHPDLQAAFRLAEPASLALMRVRSGNANANWPAGPVTVLGDAMHAMSPAGGLGANTALRDAAALAAQLGIAAAGQQPLAVSLASYQSGLRARAAEAIRLSQDAEDQLLERRTFSPH
ncbi:FAD-dependent oxidoreductase [Chromobacterium sphagni]|uniref:FAD-binding domain-containing protein n=1 Tax=Chromobacterium sphagni TaxID=1903179 RepID=A0A1S1X3M5_9NEIS|nr:FAD-dependent monooxygenase [Chromobacterium sphagni]OHX14079.1 hypothetical protein BI347_11585 [Chromobacterium sphagni]OHX20286.1 hypothetical protein BI344_07285 [Chromobacterium sphagni]